MVVCAFHPHPNPLPSRERGCPHRPAPLGIPCDLASLVRVPLRCAEGDGLPLTPS